MRTAAILPVKRLGLAKQRLRASVAEELRAGLAQAMVADVLSALSRLQLDRAHDRRHERACGGGRRRRSQGALVVADAAENGQSAAVASASRARLRGVSSACCAYPATARRSIPRELDELLTERGAARADRTAPTAAGRDRARPPRQPAPTVCCSARPTRSRPASARTAARAIARWRGRRRAMAPGAPGVAAAGHRHGRGSERVARAPAELTAAGASHARRARPA